ncbi:HAMP domain-containing sensor histidine kinase [Streptomyces sp. BE147]|uniref:HAMP domain-containing sensor histidine kinase n=1 Tax=unclassified Streptomyces TaxID=2593676 RepID=UPI002E77F7C5|nr:HAMP domain-containing sensor histidine kinase [Streptomyces sp. BE147]MEE1741471.1 HAMP domain-containing sensor histidine kinase [Streptomyces sp. BE147]
MRRRRPRAPAWTATLTWKSAVFLTVMCCTLAALLGVLVHSAVTRQTVGHAREKALDRLEEVTRAYEAGEPLPRGSGIDPAGLPASLRALAVGGEQGTLVTDDAGAPAMWAAGPADGRALATWIDYSQSAHTISGLDRAIVGSSLLAIAATLLVGLFAVSRVTRRLHQSARVARRISAGDLDARVEDPRTARPARAQDEVAIVAGALDTMASTLQRKLQTEQRFTADVAHELRTPLTGLSAAAELLPPGRPAELVRDRVRAMRALTEDLLEISRLDARTEQTDPAVHELAPVVERVVRASGTDTGVRITGAARVETDRRRLERVIGNLVANAHRHGGPPVVVTVEGPVVTVRDHGGGFPAYLLETGPQRFRTDGGGRGHGLGLTIAVGQARVIGAELVFGNAEDGGAVARLTLPEYVASDEEPEPGTAGPAPGPDGRRP